MISSGTSEQDLGLDLIDDMLDEMGVPYDVLNASEETLTQERLVTDGKGNYNGIILTDASLYYTGPGNYLASAFSLDEWKILHQYEIDFEVRESVLSGYPVSGAYYKINYDLDYGMDLDTIEANSSFSANWQIPAEDKEIYEYVNRQGAFVVNDYSRMVHPLNDPEGPTVTPLLTESESGKALISVIEYPDGREVLLSTITNAWYLIHSQVLAYEFLNYATQGVFIGSRKVYLAAHIDDIFIENYIWDPVLNQTTGDIRYRTTAQDIENLVTVNNQFIANNPNISDFKLDFVFNGEGAAAAPPEPVSLISAQDTYINSLAPTNIYGSQKSAYAYKSRLQKERTLFFFDLPSNIDNLASQAILTLTTKDIPNMTSTRDPKGTICLVTQEWDESASWLSSMENVLWSRSGGRFNRQSCVPYQESNDLITVDITSIVNLWQNGDRDNLGLIMRAKRRNYNRVQVHTREADNANYHPQLSIVYQQEAEPLTDTVVANKDEFRFLNHTLSHRDMYTSSGATYDIAYEEINENLKVWQRLGFPDFAHASKSLVTGNHSGLEDAESSDDTYPPPEITPYPEGLNFELVYAMQALNIEYIASDSSRVNQDYEHFIQGTNIMLLPRYPTALFYNATTPTELTDEYNYIFYERYIENGEDPCFIAGAICQPRSYEEILAAEAEITLRHMLTYKSWPHYFHAANLRDYGDGATLQYDWLEVVAEKYNSVLNLPIINLDYSTIGEMSKEKLLAKEANVRGFWNRDNNTITLIADEPTTARVTGVTSDDNYGGQYILRTVIDQNGEVLEVNRSLD
ncbi:hypothetical protein DZ860_00260 [Vibrio sinensis]|uniref:DNRLRE domain-containing protein n=1 Tax=Vibrio sinensis TaxID=2302434 RepID=A0A3A6R205_9VIBR|nr:hypothetical protein DZ860_00260 [Vibrio sinensis]